jgi:hypothetical protein
MKPVTVAPDSMPTTPFTRGKTPTTIGAGMASTWADISFCTESVQISRSARNPFGLALKKTGNFLKLAAHFEDNALRRAADRCIVKEAKKTAASRPRTAHHHGRLVDRDIEFISGECDESGR